MSLWPEISAATRWPPEAVGCGLALHMPARTFFVFFPDRSSYQGWAAVLTAAISDRPLAAGVGLDAGDAEGEGDGRGEAEGRGEGEGKGEGGNMEDSAGIFQDTSVDDPQTIYNIL